MATDMSQLQSQYQAFSSPHSQALDVWCADTLPAMADCHARAISQWLTTARLVIELELPWPSKDLSPNARLHWAKKAKAVKAARAEAYLIAIHHKRPLEGRILFVLEFFPPDRRHYDDDGLLARMKSARDGIADALGVDDRRFVTQFSVSEEVVRGGLVKVTISEAKKSPHCEG